LLQQLAVRGDLLVLYRPDPDSTDIHGIIAQPGTQLEVEIVDALNLGGVSSLRRFFATAPKPASQLQAGGILTAITESPPPAADVHALQIYVKAIAEGEMPSTREMAAAAQELVITRNGGGDPDSQLHDALRAETDIYRAIEEALAEAELAQIRSAGFQGVMDYCMSLMQSRRSRRGQSLQNHVEHLLRQCEIPFQPQCPTENGEKPDFIVPSKQAYDDPSFPAERLHMIGCKSRVRERWRQYLNEAARIPVKYHVSLDEDLTPATLRAMHDAGLRLFMPEASIVSAYSRSPARPLIGTIAALVRRLQQATQGSVR
jgi:hypothetical protein